MENKTEDKILCLLDPSVHLGDEESPCMYCCVYCDNYMCDCRCNDTPDVCPDSIS